MISWLFTFTCTVAAALYNDIGMLNANEEVKTFKITSAPDFEITGEGNSIHWAKSEWLIIPQRKSVGVSLFTRVKALYSPTGIYFLFQCEDRRLTATMIEDFLE